MWRRPKRDLRELAPSAPGETPAAAGPDVGGGGEAVTETVASPPAPAPEAPAPSANPFHLRVLPIIGVIGLWLALYLFTSIVFMLVESVFRFAALHDQPLFINYVGHAIQCLVALGLIWVLRYWIPGDYGLQWPPGRSYVGTALLIGVFFGLLMTAVDYAPQLLKHTAPTLEYKLTPGAITGWLFFEGVYVGPTEEIPFRALLLTFLTATMPGRLRFRGYEMNGAGVVIAVLFALAHADSFVTRPFLMAFGQMLYAFALGVAYAYWFEKSRSVLAPIVGHNASDVTEYALLYTMVTYWG